MRKHQFPFQDQMKQNKLKQNKSTFFFFVLFWWELEIFEKVENFLRYTFKLQKKTEVLKKIFR